MCTVAVADGENGFIKNAPKIGTPTVDWLNPRRRKSGSILLLTMDPPEAPPRASAHHCLGPH